ncbi:MAG: class IV adenylate cyclase [Vicinamibacterales bacterium]
MKLKFASPEDARRRVLGLGAAPARPRRLQRDVIVDTADGGLVSRGCALRVRDDGGAGALTFKGPVTPGLLKVREEIETTAGDPGRLLAILDALGYRPVFRYEKYREEFAVPGVVIAIDETPIGVFVEIEGDADAIHACARRLGRTEGDYITASYRSLYLAAAAAEGAVGDMTFGPAGS